MSSKKHISVADDFSPSPAGRYRTDGEFSGERFREEFLSPAFDQFELVVVDLDGTSGYGSSFLDEAFGGLVRLLHLSEAELKRRLDIKSTRESYLIRAWGYIHEAATSGARA